MIAIFHIFFIGFVISSEWAKWYNFFFLSKKSKIPRFVLNDGSIVEPVSSIRYRLACAYIEDLNQSVRRHSLIS